MRLALCMAYAIVAWGFELLGWAFRCNPHEYLPGEFRD